jgi:hypothetical protein
MKGLLIVLTAVLFLVGCANGRNISVHGGNSGVSGGVSTSIPF